MVVLALVKMAEWMRHGPKDVIEIDDEDEMTEAKLYGRIHSQWHEGFTPTSPSRADERYVRRPALTIDKFESTDGR